MQAIFEVYPKTQWSVRFFRDDSIELPIGGSTIIDGLDSSRNYLPREVVEYVIPKIGQRFFNGGINKNSYLCIKVLRNDKWITVFNWPVYKFDIVSHLETTLPYHKYFDWFKP